MTFNQSTILNDSADFWHYDICVNVFPADTKRKRAYENWTQWQDQSIPDDVHEARKKNGDYNKGIAIMPGKIRHGLYAGKYLVTIDLDNKKSIEEFCKYSGLPLEEVKRCML